MIFVQMKDKDLENKTNASKKVLVMNPRKTSSILRGHLESLSVPRLNCRATMSSDSSPATVVPEKKMPKRCEFSGCQYKLNIVAFPCRCTSYYCPKHRPSDLHSCTFDYKSEGKNLLLKTMSSAVVSAKIDII